MRDPVELEIFKNLFHSIAEEMGAALRRTAFSPNIKERRDYSCAVFDGAGEVIAMGDHMPVHLGSMPMSVRAASRDAHAQRRRRGDAERSLLRRHASCPTSRWWRRCFVNRGRSKRKRAQTPAFYVASRAHHADVGGTYAGSMGMCREIYQEGIRIPPIKLMPAARCRTTSFRLLLNNVRTPEEREGDLNAQIAACHTGCERACWRFASVMALARVQQVTGELLEYSEELMRAFLWQGSAGPLSGRGFSRRRRRGFDGPVRIAVALTFSAAGRQAAGHCRFYRQLAAGCRAASMPWTRSLSPPASTSSAACCRKMFPRRLG